MAETTHNGTDTRFPKIGVCRRMSAILRSDYFYTEMVKPNTGCPDILKIGVKTAIPMFLLGLVSPTITLNPPVVYLYGLLAFITYLTLGIHIALWAISRVWRVWNPDARTI